MLNLFDDSILQQTVQPMALDNKNPSDAAVLAPVDRTGSLTFSGPRAELVLAVATMACVVRMGTIVLLGEPSLFKRIAKLLPPSLVPNSIPLDTSDELATRPEMIWQVPSSIQQWSRIIGSRVFVYANIISSQILALPDRDPKVIVELLDGLSPSHPMLVRLVDTLLDNHSELELGSYKLYTEIQYTLFVYLSRILVMVKRRFLPTDSGPESYRRLFRELAEGRYAELCFKVVRGAVTGLNQPGGADEVAGNMYSVGQHVPAALNILYMLLASEVAIPVRRQLFAAVGPDARDAKRAIRQVITAFRAVVSCSNVADSGQRPLFETTRKFFDLDVKPLLLLGLLFGGDETAADSYDFTELDYQMLTEAMTLSATGKHNRNFAGLAYAIVILSRAPHHAAALVHAGMTEPIVHVFRSTNDEQESWPSVNRFAISPVRAICVDILVNICLNDNSADSVIGHEDQAHLLEAGHEALLDAANPLEPEVEAKLRWLLSQSGGNEKTTGGMTSPAALTDAAADSDNPGHVMISYCWAQQEVVIRIKQSLASRGYNCWIDIEQMSQSTVDSMATAIESAAVILVAVSEDYKASANCRLEANYAHQQKKSMTFLMLQEG